MRTRYFLMEIREIPGDVIDIRTRKPLLTPVPEVLPAPSEPAPQREPMSEGRFFGLCLDAAASIAIVALCAVFWIELML